MHEPLPPWSPSRLRIGARSIGASRRTDVPALYAPWLAHRFEEGFSETTPPRGIRRRVSLAPEDVTYVNLWTKWPRPALGVLRRLREAGYPVLWNVTITGLGGTAVEPHVPPPDRVVAAVAELAQLVPAAAILWRFDPVFLSERYPLAWHVETLKRLSGMLAGHVDRIASSFVTRYGRRVVPDLLDYAAETGDDPSDPDLRVQVDAASRLRDTAAAEGLALTICCMPELQAALPAEPSGCNAWGWAARAYPELQALPPARAKPCRPGCACSDEVDIGAYDTCTLGCRYSYGTCRESTARARSAGHDAGAASLLPATSP